MMRYILLNICILISVIGVKAEALNFSDNIHVFGTIEEEGGVVTHKFEFRNVGDLPAVINNVRTTCGCTTSDYSKRPINPGEKSSITVSYDPLYRPGIFNKDIYVYSSDSGKPYILKIKGDVSPRKLSMEERYPYTLGSVGRIGALYISFRAVERGALVQQSVEYINIGMDEVEIDFKVRNRDSRLQLYFDRRAESGDHKRLEVGYFIDPKSDERGRLWDTIDIFVNKKLIDKKVFVKGLIVESK